MGDESFQQIPYSGRADGLDVDQRIIFATGPIVSSDFIESRAPTEGF